jgi:anti-anti-sigma regulatory factor
MRRRDRSSWRDDPTTSDEIYETLEPLYGSVLIDLSGADFIDSSVVGIIFRDSHRRAREGDRLERISDLGNEAISQLLQILRIAEVLTVPAIDGVNAGAARVNLTAARIPPMTDSDAVSRLVDVSYVS